MMQWWRRFWGGAAEWERGEAASVVVDEERGRSGRQPTLLLRIRVRSLAE